MKLAVLTLTNATGTGNASVCSATSSGASGRRAPASGASWSRRWTTPPECCWRATATTPTSAGVAFWRATETPRSHTGDRGEFVGRNRTLSAPAALFREQLAGRTGAGFDVRSLAALLEIEPGESRSVAFVLGQGAIGLMRSNWPRAMPRWRRRERRSPRSSARGTRHSAPCRSAPRRFVRSHRQSLAALPDIDVSRLGAQRSYQPGGAFGFRDQLQDVLALMCAAGPVSRAPPARRVAAVRRGRRAALVASAERARDQDTLLRRSALAPCVAPATCRRAAMNRCSTKSSPSSKHRCSGPINRRPTCCRVVVRNRVVFEHSMRAIAHAMKCGAHGLPLIGSGDWNDGMNRVGHAGRGERVARLVSRDRAQRFRSDLRAPRAKRPRPEVSGRGAMADRHAGAGLGRRLVSPRVFRRRNAARVRCRTRNASSIR